MFRLRLYQRYLMRETLGAIFLVLAAFLALFSFFDLINELRSVGKGGYQLGHAVVYVALSLPGLIFRKSGLNWSPAPMSTACTV